MRKILIVILLVVAVIGVGIVYFVSNVDRFVKHMIEDSGTRVVGTQVSVGSVELSLGDRLVVIRDVEIANPPGFSSDPAFRIGEASAQLDLDDYRIIRKIFAGGVAIQVESKGLDTNFKQLQENVSDYSARSQKDSKPAADDEEIHLVIDLAELDKAQARLVSDVLAEPLAFETSKLVMRDLSGTPEQVSYQMMQQITAAVVSAAALKVLEAQARDKGGDVMEAVEELLENLNEDTEGNQ